MKTKEAAFVAVAVAFRTASLAAALWGLFIFLMPLVGFGKGFSSEVAFNLLRILGVYFVAAIALWVISKPAAALVLRGLDFDRGISAETES